MSAGEPRRASPEIFQETAAKFSGRGRAPNAGGRLGDHVVGVRDPGRAHRSRPEGARRRARRHRGDDDRQPAGIPSRRRGRPAHRRDAVRHLRHLGDRADRLPVRERRQPRRHHRVGVPRPVREAAAKVPAVAEFVVDRRARRRSRDARAARGGRRPPTSTSRRPGGRSSPRTSRR